jgi:hypothetical protein
MGNMDKIPKPKHHTCMEKGQMDGKEFPTRRGKRTVRG